MSGAILGETTFAAVGLLFLFTAIRTFTSTLYLSLYGNASNETIGGIALAVFAASVLAVVPAARLGPRGGVALSATILAGATILGTAVRNDTADAVLSGVALVGGTWWLALTQSARSGVGGSAFVLGLPIALALDLGMRSALHTIPAVDLSTPVALALVVAAALVLLAAGMAAFSGEREWTSPGFRGALALVAVPALVLVAELGATNPGQTAGVAGARGPTSPGTWYVMAASLGVGIVGGAAALSRVRPSRRLVATLALAAGAGLVAARIPLASAFGAVLLAGGAFAAAALLADTAARPARSPVVAAGALAAGWVLFVALAFAYYAYYALPAAPPVAAGVVILGLVAAQPLPQPRFGLAGAVLVGLLTVVLPVGVLLTGPAVTSADPRPTFRLMTYNVHQGFDEGNVPALDRIGDTIATEAPDVVVLQEVARGWMIAEQHDVLTALAERLGMSYVFGPTIGDAYGNAVLSKMPLSDVRYVAFERQAALRHQPRGAILLRVADVLVIATHLDHVDGASEVRQGQVREIVSAWAGASPAVVAGDLNALPDTPELRLLEEAGFRDLVRDDGADQPTSPATVPRNRVDYVWGIGVTGSQAHTVASNASDHRPVVINVTRRP